MTRRDREKRVVGLMTTMYCRHHHKPGTDGLCPECAELVRYARARIDRCPHGAHKVTCRLCATHCYSPAHREAIRRVMRYAGPRMLLHHPLAAIRHLLAEHLHI